MKGGNWVYGCLMGVRTQTPNGQYSRGSCTTAFISMPASLVCTYRMAGFDLRPLYEYRRTGEQVLKDRILPVHSVVRSASAVAETYCSLNEPGRMPRALWQRDLVLLDAERLNGELQSRDSPPSSRLPSKHHRPVFLCCIAIPF
jgi:hypothetical protein